MADPGRLSHFKSSILNIHSRLVELTGWQKRESGVEDPPPTPDQSTILGCMESAIMALEPESRAEIVALETRWIGMNAHDKTLIPWDALDYKKWGLLVCYASRIFATQIEHSRLSQAMKDAVEEERDYVSARIRSYLKVVKPQA